VLFREAPEASTQALLGFVGERDHATRLPFTSSLERDAHARSMLIVPGGFHQHPADQRIARSCDPAAPMFLATRILAGDKAQVRHQRARRLEPTKIVQLSENQDRRQRVDAAETPQPRHRFPVRVGLRGLRQLCIQLEQPLYSAKITRGSISNGILGDRVVRLRVTDVRLADRIRWPRL
jgi:hypothetical protein